MAPSSYTELFFLDEATALAAGHRPCGECRSADAKRFKNLWLEANGTLLQGKSGTMANMDAILHSERIGRDGTQRRWEACVSELPDGALVLVNDPRARTSCFTRALCTSGPLPGMSREERSPRGER